MDGGAQALHVLANKLPLSTAALNPPTCELAKRVLHTVSYDCSSKWLVAVQRESTPVTALFSNLFTQSLWGKDSPY
eukprot:2756169-Pyramimonas_sp.AAC.1